MDIYQHIKHILILGTYICTGACFIQAQGFGPDSSQLAAFKSFNQGHGYQVYWNTKTGTPEAIFGIKVQQRLHIPGVSELSPENVARKFLKQHREIFKMPANLEELEISRIRSNKGIAHIRFQQTYQDIPIVGGEYFVHVNEIDKGIHMANGRYFPGVQLTNKPDGTVNPTILENAAVELARFAVETETIPMDTVVSRLVIYPKDESHFLAWEIIIVPQGKLAEWRVYVDAVNGDLLWKENILQYVNGTGRVYPTDPDDSYQTKSLYRLYSPGYELEGTYVRAKNDDGSEAYNTNCTFVYSPTNTHFDEVNVYYHADRFAYDFIGLGYTGLPYQIPAIVHWGVDEDNAGYSPTNNEIYFGDGNVIFNDLAKKDDVIYHEYTHAISDDIGLAYNTATESAAMNEAYSDYFTATFTNDPHIGEWVTISESDLRRMDTDKDQWNYDNWYSSTDLYYNSLTNYDWYRRHYTRGMIWSGALWDLRNELNNNYLTDELIYNGLEYANGDATFLQGRAGIIQYDEDHYAGAHVNTIKTVFADRGIGPYPISVSISGPSGLTFKQWGTFTAVIVNGYGTITYQWYKKVDGASTWTTRGTSISQNERMGTVGFTLKVVVTMNSNSYEATKYCANTSAPKILVDVLPQDYSLYPNYPNPFNPVTTLAFDLLEVSHVALAIYDLRGREVSGLVNKELTAGSYKEVWNGTDRLGNQLPSGIYICRIAAIGLETGRNYTTSRKMVLLK